MHEKTRGLPTKGLLVKQMMDANVDTLKPTDPLRKAVELYYSSRNNILPVVDAKNRLIGGLPRKRLLKVFLDGTDLDTPVKMYMVQNPVAINANLEYDEVSFVFRVGKSKVDSVIVVNDDGKVVGTIGMSEYLRASLDVILASSATLEATFLANHEGIIIVDKEDRIMRMNPAAEAMFDIVQAQVQGEPISQVLPEIVQGQERVKPPTKKRRAQQADKDDKFKYKRTVKSLPVLINAVPIMEKGEKIGSSYAFLDVSDVERVARELAIVRTMQSTIDGVINASSDGVLVSNMDGTVNFVNVKACELLQAKSNDIIGKSVQNILHSVSPMKVTSADRPIVDTVTINGKKCFVSHLLFRPEDKGVSPGIVSTIFLGDSKLTEEMALQWIDMNRKIEYYRAELEKRDESGGSRFDQIITLNHEFEKIKSDAMRISRSSSTVLLTGESGVGKSMFARGIHETSPRAGQPFVVVNCVSIPETLFESELFGYAPGAFTGALKSGKPGYFERADKGTIFMDEIGDIPMAVQAKLLQVLQDKEFERVGGTKKQSVDVRIIAATNKDLREGIANRTFREDLFYRLNVIEFNLPPLRERKEDILPLAEAFIVKYNEILGAHVTGINREAEKVLLSYDWRGNVRELENAIEHAVNFVWEGEIATENLPTQIVRRIWSTEDFSEEKVSGYKSARKDFEREMVLDALRKTSGNKSAAARLLNLSRSAFYDRLTKYGIAE
jgi:PAS domain S-box-containing protein